MSFSSSQHQYPLMVIYMNLNTHIPNLTILKFGYVSFGMNTGETANNDNIILNGYCTVNVIYIRVLLPTL